MGWEDITAGGGGGGGGCTYYSTACVVVLVTKSKESATKCVRLYGIDELILLQCSGLSTCTLHVFAHYYTLQYSIVASLNNGLATLMPYPTPRHLPPPPLTS